MDSPEIEFYEDTPVTIIGSSGRNEPINLKTYESAKNKCIEYIKSLPVDISDIILKSGGSSGIDHLAVILFLEGIDGKNFSGLNLFLPCPINFESKKFFADNKYTESASKMLNDLHARFSRNISRDTFEDFLQIHNKSNVSIEYGMGFYARNRMLAKVSDTTIAMTFGKGKVPADGGTKYTWDLIKGTKIHIPLEKID